MRTRGDFFSKVDYEGGIGGSLSYFGRDLSQQGYDLPADFIENWAKAYDAVAAVEDALNEWESEMTTDDE